MKKEETVFVNGRAKAYFPGMSVKFAIGPDQAKLVRQGRKKVVDSLGFEVGLEGSLSPGSKLQIVDR